MSLQLDWSCGYYYSLFLSQNLKNKTKKSKLENNVTIETDTHTTTSVETDAPEVQTCYMETQDKVRNIID